MKPDSYFEKDLNALYEGCWRCRHSITERYSTLWCSRHRCKVRSHGRCDDWQNFIEVKTDA